MIERWLPVVGYEGLYEVSSLGRVRSLDRTVAHPKGTAFLRGAIMKLNTYDKGYLKVRLSKGGKQKTQKVHQLVANAFLGPCPPRMEVRHLDGDPGNAALCNLQYGTRRRNLIDRTEHGRDHNASKRACDSGHEFNRENTRVYTKNGRPARACRRCAAEAQARYRSRKKVAS